MHPIMSIIDNQDSDNLPGMPGPAGGNLAQALAYARHGWPVLPLHTPRADGRCTCNKQDCDTIGKHPRTQNGAKDATTDEQCIERWWELWPQANIGIATGAASGLVVIDIDTGGDEGWADLVAAHAALPDTIESITGSGGRHLLFATGTKPLRNSVKKLATGVDVRGEGGYIVAPPSLHRSGWRYAWEVSGHPDDIAPAPLPSWLEGRIHNGSLTPAPSAGGHDEGMAIPAGQRNATLASLAGAMRRKGASQIAIAAALLAENAERCDPPLPEREVERIAASISRYPSEDPSVPAPTTGSGLRLLTDDEVLTLPPPVWLVDGILVCDTVAVLSGPPASYKSFLALDFALSVAAGQPWAGHAVKQGPVVYVAAEGRGGLSKRLRAWRIATQRGSVPCRFFPEAVNLRDGVAVQHLLNKLDAMPEPPKLVVIDTLARCMPGGDENSNKEMGELVDACDRIRRHTGACVLLLHHVTKGTGQLRGASALLGALDTHLEMDRDGNTVAVSCGKQKDAEPFATIFLTRTIVELGADGETSLILRAENRERATGHQRPERPLNANQRAVRDTLARLGSATATVWQRESGLSSSSFYRIKDELEQMGGIVHDKVGKGALNRVVEPLVAGQQGIDAPQAPRVLPACSPESDQTALPYSLPIGRGSSSGSADVRADDLQQAAAGEEVTRWVG